MFLNVLVKRFLLIRTYLSRFTPYALPVFCTLRITDHLTRIPHQALRINTHFASRFTLFESLIDEVKTCE